MADEITEARREPAEAARWALIEIAMRAYEEAGLAGLCDEGRWEAAVGAMQNCERAAKEIAARQF